MGESLEKLGINMLVLGTSIALFFLAMRWAGGLMVASDNPTFASVGKAVLTVYP